MEVRHLLGVYASLRFDSLCRWMLTLLLSFYFFLPSILFCYETRYPENQNQVI